MLSAVPSPAGIAFLDGQKRWNRRRECLGEGSLHSGSEGRHGGKRAASGAVSGRSASKGNLTMLALREVMACSYRVGRAFSAVCRAVAGGRPRARKALGPRQRACALGANATAARTSEDNIGGSGSNEITAKGELLQ